MGLNRSKGNMYDWVTHTWSPIIGCPHQCKYCYVKSFQEQPVRPVLRDDWPRLGEGRTIFVGHLCDMFAERTPRTMIQRVLDYCAQWPKNQYVFQTKNPDRFLDFDVIVDAILGTTIETNRANMLSQISKAPPPQARADALAKLGQRTFVTVEPILDFDTVPLAEMIANARPDFVNIGADSKGHGLPEPTRSKVQELVEELNLRGIGIRKKLNLKRLTE